MPTQSNPIIMFFSRVNQFLSVNNTLIGNHLIVILAFFLPTIESARSSIIFMLTLLLFFKSNIFGSLKDVLKNRVVQAFLLFWLLNLILANFSLYPDLSFKYVIGLKILFYPVLILLFLDRTFIPRIIGAFILGMLISEILSYGLAFHLIEYIPYSISYASAEDPSPFIYHMGYGFILAFTATLLLQRALKNALPVQRFLYILFFITVSINVFVNAGRTGYVIYAIAIITLLLQMYRKQFMKTVTLVTVFLVVVYTLAFQFSPLFQQRMNLAITSVKNIINKGDLHSSIGFRVAMGGMAIESIKDRPIIGHGPASASIVVSQKARELKSDSRALCNIPFENIDNQYLESLVTIGFFGFIFLLNIFIQIIRSKQEDVELKTMQIVLLTLVIAYGFEATVMTHNGYIPKLFIIFTTFTLVTKEQLKPLDNLNLKTFSFYTLASISILILSKTT